MVLVTSKLGAIEVPQAHMWKDRKASLLFERTPLITPTTRIATIGSCFAAEIAGAMARLQMQGAMHPGGLFYTTKSIRQEMARIFSGDTSMAEEPLWKAKAGYVQPFHAYNRSFPSPEAAREWSDELDRRAQDLFRQADLYVITLGLIEAWLSPKTGLAYRGVPHPDVFPELGARMHRLTVEEMIGDLVAIRDHIRKHTTAPIIFTVSPVPLHLTFTQHDVRIANTESKSRIRAAVSEFIERYDDVHYFHSYEIVSTAERASDFMVEDGRHVHRHAVDYIVAEFLRMFAGEGVAVPAVDTAWLTPPTKTAARPAAKPNGANGALRRAASLVWRRLPNSIRKTLRDSVKRSAAAVQNGRTGA
jgi:hypothetical protein